MAGVVLPNLPAGSKYQIAFVTAGTRAAESASISNYNTYVTNEASYSQSLPQTTWRAWVSTATTNAKDNAPTYADVPIYNTRGQLIATNSAEFLFPTHRATMAFDQYGITGNREVWTGSDYRGVGISSHTVGSNRSQMGNAANSTDSLQWASFGDQYSVGYGARSIYAISSVLTVPLTVPFAPTNLVGTPGNGQVSLTWTAPASTGGSPITHYLVEYRASTASQWIRFADGTSTATSATVTGLNNGTPYVFRVSAVNGAGTGEFSTPSAPVTPRTVPTTPRNLVGTPGDRQVRLTWSAPASDGGSPIFRYIVQLKTTTATAWTTPIIQPAPYSPAYTVTGLTNGQPYMFRVALVNEAGTGEWAGTVGTPRTVATAPTNLVGRPGNGRVSLTWTAPSSNDDSAITDYIVQYRASTSSTWITFPDGTSTTTSATVTGLTSGMAYVFRVAAVNGAGTGAYTATVSATPQATLDSVVGRWRWFNGGTFEFLSDGQVIEHLSNGSIRYRADASWRRPDANVSRYTMTWGNHQFIDDLVLSSDLRSLKGRNQFGTVVTGQRIDHLPSSDPKLIAPRSIAISGSVNLESVRLAGGNTVVSLVVFARTGVLQSAVRDSQVEVRSVSNKWGGTTLSMVGTATAIDRNLRHITYQGNDPSINIQIAANRRNWGSHDIALMRETPSVSRRVAFRAFGAR